MLWDHDSIGFYENLFTQVNALFVTQSERRDSNDSDYTNGCAIKFVSPCILNMDGDNRVTTAFIDKLFSNTLPSY